MLTKADTRRWTAAALVAGLLAAAHVDGAAAAPRPRPSDGAPGAASEQYAPNGLALYNDFRTPERVYAGRSAVVHYVTSGVSAPPLNDDDGDGVPDYVERVAAAADRALDYYSRRGFRAVRPDRGGPDARPDLYVTRFTPGTFGVALPAAEAAAGAFTAVSNALDPSPTESLGSLDGTVAHELFHLVQFSYFSAAEDPAIPVWTLEGSAAAMERRVSPEIDDIVASLQLRRWFAAPQRPITAQSYGAQLLWERLDRRYPRLLPAFLARLAARPVRGEGRRELAATFRLVTGRAFAPEFHAFALAAAADHGAKLARVRRIGGGTVRAAVAAFAIHYVGLSLRHAAGRVTLRLRSAAAGARATLVYELESETPGEPSTIVRAAGRRLVGGAVAFRIPAVVHRNPRFTHPLLVLSNGSPVGAAPYRLTVS